MIITQLNFHIQTLMTCSDKADVILDRYASSIELSTDIKALRPYSLNLVSEREALNSIPIHYFNAIMGSDNDFYHVLEWDYYIYQLWLQKKAHSLYLEKNAFEKLVFTYSQKLSHYIHDSIDISSIPVIYTNLRRMVIIFLLGRFLHPHSIMKMD